MKKTILVIFMSFFLADCGFMTESYGLFMDDEGRRGLFTPRPFQMRGIPQGDDSYSRGFRDGCNISIGMIGSGLHRMDGFGYDPNRGIEDKDYYLGYRTGDFYCAYYLDSDPI